MPESVDAMDPETLLPSTRDDVAAYLTHVIDHLRDRPGTRIGERDIALAIRVIMNAVVHLTVHVEESSLESDGSILAGHGKQGLSRKERRNLEIVRAMLEEGKNPFTKEAMEARGCDTGVGTQSHMDPKREGRIEISRSEIKRREERWSKREEGRAGTGRYLPGDFPNAPFKITPYVADPTKRFCSFCGIQGDLGQMTEGKSKLKAGRRIETIVLPDGTLQQVEKKIHYTDKLWACPEHVLLIAPSIRYWCSHCPDHSKLATCATCGHRCEETVETNNIKWPASSED